LLEQIAFGITLSQVIVDHHEKFAHFFHHFFTPFGVCFQLFEEVVIAKKCILKVSFKGLFYIFFTSSVVSEREKKLELELLASTPR